MKKLFSILILAATFLATNVNAQSTTPRWGITPNADNTFRNLAHSYLVKNDVAGTDTFKLTASNYEVYVNTLLTDSCVYMMKTLGGAFLYDQIKLYVTNTSGSNHKIRFTNRGASPWVFAVAAGDSVLTLNSGKQAFLTFEFNGTKYVEKSKLIQ